MTGAMYLAGLSYQLGTLSAIESLPELARDPEALSFLQAMGCRGYAHLERPIGEVLGEVGRNVLARAKTQPDHIGAVVYCSSSFDAATQGTVIPRLCADLELASAIPFGVFLGNCTNFSLGLTTAMSLCQRFGKSVLLLAADCLATSERDSRIPDKRICVLSDAVVGGVVSAATPSGYAILGSEHRHRPELCRLDRSVAMGEVAYIEAMSETVRGICERLRGRLRATVKDFSWIVTGNYHAQIMQSYAELAGFPLARLYSDNLPRFGHSFAADQLIALADLADSGRVRAGDRVLMVGTSDFLWSATAVRAV